MEKKLSEIKLNLFCGFDHRQGYENIDALGDFDPDLVWDCRDPLPYEPESVSEILAIDGLEHLNHVDAENTIAKWAEILREGGKLTIRVPDWDLTDKENVKHVFGELHWKGVELGDFGTHKWAYTKTTLSKLVAKYLDVLEIKNELGNIILIAIKSNGQTNENSL